jgi:hypothetical protein
MIDTCRAQQICLLLLLGIAACRDVGIPDVCRQKITPRLLNEISDTSVKEKKYRVVITFSDSTGIAKIAPSISIASNSVATGFLTAAELRRLCVLQHVQFIDLAKRFHKLDQN